MIGLFECNIQSLLHPFLMCPAPEYLAAGFTLNKLAVVLIDIFGDFACCLLL
jgi:hypothetical protein